MKRFLFLLLCFIGTMCFAQPEIISGNGNIKKETRQLGDYTGISLSGNMNVQVSYGKSNSIMVEGDENLLQYVETFIDNGSLVVKTKNKIGIKSKNKIIIYATLTKVDNLKLSGSGNISGNGDFSNNGRTNISIAGSGNINFGMNTFNETKIAVSGSGNVTLKGKSTNNIDASISGSGNIDASDVSCNDVFAQVSGSGNIKVFANRSIDAKVSGSGNIYYRGAASKHNIKSSGSGKIIKV